jgi:hypothetical protein
MPFKSDKQKKWMFANKPKMAKRWAKKGKVVSRKNLRQKVLGARAS